MNFYMTRMFKRRIWDCKVNMDLREPALSSVFGFEESADEK
jgi:hypothetical protein